MKKITLGLAAIIALNSSMYAEEIILPKIDSNQTKSIQIETNNSSLINNLKESIKNGIETVEKKTKEIVSTISSNLNDKNLTQDINLTSIEDNSKKLFKKASEKTKEFVQDIQDINKTEVKETIINIPTKIKDKINDINTTEIKSDFKEKVEALKKNSKPFLNDQNLKNILKKESAEIARLKIAIAKLIEEKKIFQEELEKLKKEHKAKNQKIVTKKRINKKEEKVIIKKPGFELRFEGKKRDYIFSYKKRFRAIKTLCVYRAPEIELKHCIRYIKKGHYIWTDKATTNGWLHVPNKGWIKGFQVRPKFYGKGK